MTGASTQPGRLVVTGHTACLKCGYDLHGQPMGGRCPECGETVDASAGTLRDRMILSLHLRDVTIAAWILGVMLIFLPLLAAAGGGLRFAGLSSIAIIGAGLVPAVVATLCCWAEPPLACDGPEWARLRVQFVLYAAATGIASLAIVLARNGGLVALASIILVWAGMLMVSAFMLYLSQIGALTDCVFMEHLGWFLAWGPVAAVLLWALVPDWSGHRPFWPVPVLLGILGPAGCMIAAAAALPRIRRALV